MLKNKPSARSSMIFFCILLFALYIAISIYLSKSPSASERLEECPVGIDYMMLYTSGELTLEGRAAEIYNVPKLQAIIETGLLGNPMPKDVQWFYPPTGLLAIVALFSVFPFHVSLILWLAVTLLLAWLAVYRLLPGRKYLSLMTLGFPAVLYNMRWGQNSFLSTAFLGFGIGFMEEKPVLAGLFFGLCTFKPQLAFFPFLLLLLTRQWKTFLWSVMFALATVALSLVLFGTQVWAAFFHHFFFVAPTLLSSIWDKTAAIQPTLYTALRLLGLGSTIVYILIGVVGILVTAVSIWIWRNTDRFALKGAILPLGTFCFMPYFIQYDLMVLVIPTVLLTYDYLEHGSRTYEKALLITCVSVVFVNLALSYFLSVQINPLAALALLLTIFLRVRAAAAGQAALPSEPPGEYAGQIPVTEG